MPRYERRRDRVNEAQIIRTYLDANEGLSSTKLSEVHYHVDYAISDGRELWAYAEVKNRTIPFGYHDGVFLSAGKVAYGQMHAKAMGVHFIFIARFSDGTIAAADLTSIEGAHVRIDGRKDRGTTGDIEPMVIVPWHFFDIIERGHAKQASKR